MQSVARRASYNFRKVKEGNWGAFDPLHALGQELYGKTLGIFGLGRIGYEMAEKSKKAFGMDIIYHNRHQNLQAEKELDAKYVSFDELIERSDVLSVHASFTPEQEGLFRDSVFKRMKSNAIFINTARGGFHQQKDLYNALVDGQIWGQVLMLPIPNLCLQTIRFWSFQMYVFCLILALPPWKQETVWPDSQPEISLLFQKRKNATLC